MISNGGVNLIQLTCEKSAIYTMDNAFRAGYNRLVAFSVADYYV